MVGSRINDQQDPAAVRHTQVKVGWERISQSRMGQAAGNTAKGLWARVPGTDANLARKARFQAQANQVLVQGQQTGKEAQQDEKQNEGRYGSQGSATRGGQSDTEIGVYYTEMQTEFRESLRRGYSRIEEVPTTDVEIRAVLTDPGFIDVLLNQESSMTPAEMSSSSYAKSMQEKRAKLAGQLAQGRVGVLDIHDIEVLFNCMVGNVYGKGGGSFWDDSYWRERGMPTPDVAFLNYIERLAIKKHPEKEGDFIGGVLKAMASKPSTALDGVTVNKTIIDERLVDRYLDERSKVTIESAVEQFRRIVKSIMTCPASELHPILGIPGMGYAIPGVDELREIAEKGKKAKEAGDAAQVEELAKKMNDLKVQRAHISAYVEGTVRNLEHTFRELFISRENPLETIPNSFMHVKNPVLARLLKQVQSVLDERKVIMDEIEQTETHLRTRINADEKIISQLDERQMERKKQLEAELGKLERLEKLLKSINDADIHQDVKAELIEICNYLKGTAVRNETIEAKKDKLQEKYGHPLKKAAQAVVDAINEQVTEVGRISPKQWIIARIIWEESGKGIEAPPISSPKRFAWLRKFFNKSILNLRIVKAVASWLFKYTSLKALTENFFEIERDKQTGGLNVRFVGSERVENSDEEERLQHGKPYETVLGVIPYYKAMRGAIHAAVLAFTVAVGYQLWHAESAIKHLTASQKDNYDVWVLGQSRFWRPWQWLYQVPKEKTYIRIIDDHYDIPERFAKRGPRFMADAYGVTAEGDQKWLGGHQDVQLYFHQRRTGRTFLKLDTVPEDRACATKPPFSESCQSLGIRTWDDITNFTFGEVDTDDKWREGNPVCCTVKITWGEEIADGRKLNRTRVAEFIAYLRAQEDNGAELTYEFMRDEEQEAEFFYKGFLVSQEDDRIIEMFALKESENIKFALLQKARVEELFGPYVKKGSKELYVVPARRDDFVTLWIENIRSTLNDPFGAAVPADKMESSLEETLVQAKSEGWTEDTSEEYKKKMAEKEMDRLKIITDTARQLYLDNEDVRAFMRQFAETGSAYRIKDDKYVADACIRYLVEQVKGSGARLDDAAKTEEHIKTLLRMGYLVPAADYKAANQTREGNQTTNIAEIDAYLEKHKNFSDFLDVLIERLLESNDSVKAMHGGDGAKATAAIREEIYKILSSTSNIDKSRKQQWGITISGEGESQKIEFDSIKARLGLETYIIQFARKPEQ